LSGYPETTAPAAIAITMSAFSISESNPTPGNISETFDAVLIRATEAFQLNNFFFLQQVLIPGFF
jgi:hypothetical protein